MVYTVYRLEQLAPPPKCVISRHQVCLFVCLSVFRSLSVFFVRDAAEREQTYSNIPLSDGQ